MIRARVIAALVLALAGAFNVLRASVLEDVTFVAKLDGSEQRYVLVLPEKFDALRPHTLLVALHGHGSDRWQFARDARDECRATRDFAAKHACIFVSPDYRAKTSWMGPPAEADMVQILDDLAARFRLDKVIMCGGSMGGTASLTFAALHPDRVQGVVVLNGTANLVDYAGFPDAIAASFGGTRAERPEEYRRRSAEFWPERFTMPIAFTTGGKDTVVPPESVQRLAKKLGQQGRRVLLLNQPDGGHATDYKDTLAALEYVFNEMTAAAQFFPEMRLEPLPARAPEPKDNPSTSAKAALGRLLFFDPILSATKDVACATCHHPRLGWSDGRATPIGIGGIGLGSERILSAPNSIPPITRNVPTLLNVGFNAQVAGSKSDPALAPMFWDSRVASLERQALEPIKMREEMRGDSCRDFEAIEQAIRRVAAISEYRELFSTAFNLPQNGAVTAAHLAQAIASFERTLVISDTAYDRFLRGEKSALNAEQQRGLQVFQDAGCIQCHGGPMLSDYKLHFIGVSDGAVGGRREFRTPTLRNLKFTAPYMHDGSLRTLHDVLVFYDNLTEAVIENLDGGVPSVHPFDPLLRRMNLNPEDFPALLAFFDALSDHRYDKTVPAKVPSALPVGGSIYKP